MQIVSGTTTEHRVRLGLFLIMCLFFAAYFGYDGYHGYAAKNLEWAKYNVLKLDPNIRQEQKDQVQTNPKVLIHAIATLQQQASQGTVVTENEIQALLGKPALIMPVPAQEGSGQNWWYVGPAAAGKLHMVDGKLQSPPNASEWKAPNKSEGDILLQQRIAIGLGLLSIGVAIHYIRIMTMKTVLDESGLQAKGHQVAWEEMTGLDTSEYRKKGWLDVLYRHDGDEDQVRLDNYHIARFDDIVKTICERKGFENPIRPRDTEAAEEEEA
ncbi:MAG: hypothetical protein FWC56_01095 [Phycisphaerae bacterium]|nr:hypothetical protein [Phycisphaerae bacterium]